MSHNKKDEAAPQEMQINFPPDVQRGVYANQMVVTHSQEEFLLDFIFAASPAGVVNARVVVSPSHAKRIAAVLMDNVAKYEARFGEIRMAAPAAATAH
ncbi:MAG TPA: DUF3467 domain-containing protein [Mariprofundaceae bacterium]|nr:DUF3467 domain-containing protein [Mariprofundaceae bacterium]